MDSMDELVFKFKEHLKVLNRSSSTVSAYTDNVKNFLEAIECNDIKKVSKGMIEDYIAGLYKYRTMQGSAYSNGTICLKVRAIKRFFEFMEASNRIFIDPSEGIKEPKKEKRIIKDILSSKEVRMILDQPNLGTLMGIRDRTIMEVFYSTGIRKEELCNLSIYDADLTGKMLRVHKGKGAKDRVVPMGKHAVRYLREYIRKVRPHYTKKNHRALFVDKHGKPINKQAVMVMVKKYTTMAGIKKRTGPHMFRHCFATALVKNGADITAVQKMLGHAYPSTTQIYIRSMGLDIKRVHKRTHPREKDKVRSIDIKPNIQRIMSKNETR